MKEVRKIELSVVEDRNILKWKVSIMKDGRIVGFIKPI